MGWRDRLLRMLARGVRTRDGETLDSEVVIAVLDRIDADPALSERLDELEEPTLRAEFLRLYEGERERSR